MWWAENLHHASHDKEITANTLLEELRQNTLELEDMPERHQSKYEVWIRMHLKLIIKFATMKIQTAFVSVSQIIWKKILEWTNMGITVRILQNSFT